MNKCPHGVPDTQGCSICDRHFFEPGMREPKRVPIPDKPGYFFAVEPMSLADFRARFDGNPKKADKPKK